MPGTGATEDARQSRDLTEKVSVVGYGDPRLGVNNVVIWIRMEQKSILGEPWKNGIRGRIELNDASVQSWRRRVIT